MRKCSNILTSYMEYTDSQESPDSYHIWCCLSIIASCLRRQVWFDMGYFRIYPNMYIILIGPPGECKKSVAINVATGLIDEMEDVKISADAITREALIRVLGGTTTQTQMTPTQIYLHSSLTIISKELSVFLGSGNHDLLALLTDLYDSPNKWEYRTKNMGVDTVYNVWLNMLGASTPDWLVGSIPLTAIGGGFTSRVIFIVEHSCRKNEALPELTAQQLITKDNIKLDLEHISMLKGQFKLSNKAKDFYVNWYNNDRKIKIDKKFSGYIERKHVHLLKTSMLISVASGDSLIIEEDHIRTALTLLNSIEPNMVEAFGAVGRSNIAPDIGEIADVIKTTKEITKQALTRDVWKNVSPDAFDKSLVTLKQMGFINEYLDSKSGMIIYKWIKED